MDAAVLDELRRLRARAYGPGADIQDDAAALSRLAELEARVAVARAAAVEVQAPGAPEGAAYATSPAVPATVRDDDRATEAVDRPTGKATDPRDSLSGAELRGDDAGDDPRPPGDGGNPAIATGSHWSRRRLLAVGAVAAVALVVVTATATSAIVRPDEEGARVQAVLTVVPDATFPPFFGGRQRDGHVYTDFAGMRVLSAGEGWGGYLTDDCLVVADAESLDRESGDMYSGFSYTGCGAGPFTASLEFNVTADMPEQLRERFPLGTALQFRLEGGDVVVRSGPIAEPTSATMEP